MIYTAIILGLVGSLHCLGMCGPIVLIVPKQNNGRLASVMDPLLYHTGRLSTYAILGAMTGSIGGSLAVFGGQQRVSLVIGLLILAMVLVPRKLLGKADPAILIGRSVIKLQSYVSGRKNKFGHALSFVLGSVNGLLPCGLVYAAMAAALAFGSFRDSVAFMLLFGIGTLPMMLSVHLASSLIDLKWKSRVLKLMPVAYAILGVLFILRGLDLGIPFISPEIATDGTTLKCH